MAGRKRTADDAGAAPRSAPAKNARKGSPKAGKRGPKAIAASAFKARALPLHVNLTHTPPSIADDESVPAAPADPGFLGAIALAPSTFATGSYGWKGNKRLTVELPDPDGSGATEKVHVMLNINATVMGSKQAKEAAGEEEAAEPAEAVEDGPADAVVEEKEEVVAEE
ncbi:hypothetical protein FA95DRAFT_1559455 [Auriscalpium vulgare]|uniref:Uncharacterized protein n=1 Tax=Auriscalpium vulgare TaxID=40419 RepID=A0ACB8RTU7_9AGAM|nr:hypothetical protein FA95DRAFT_1559455 [Auriscalpium vulgare]